MIIMTKECKPKMHQWVDNQLTAGDFSYTQAMCAKCFETVIGGAELQQLMDMAKEGRLFWFESLMLLHVALYQHVRVKPSLKNDLEYLKKYLESKGMIVENNPALLVNEHDFVKAISRAIENFVEFGELTIFRGIKGNVMKITGKGMDRIPLSARQLLKLVSLP